MKAKNKLLLFNDRRIKKLPYLKKINECLLLLLVLLILQEFTNAVNERPKVFD